MELAVRQGEGIGILIDGWQSLTTADREQWIERVGIWKGRVYAKVAELSEAEAMRLRDLGSFPAVSIQGVADPSHLQAFGDLKETIRRLKDLITEVR